MHFSESAVKYPISNFTYKLLDTCLRCGQIAAVGQTVFLFNLHSRPGSPLRKPNKQTTERKKHVIKPSNSHRGPASKPLDFYVVYVCLRAIWIPSNTSYNYKINLRIWKVILQKAANMLYLKNVVLIIQIEDMYNRIITDCHSWHVWKKYSDLKYYIYSLLSTCCCINTYSI